MGVLIDMVGTLRQESISKLTAVREIKNPGIESYFKTIRDQVQLMAKDRAIVNAMTNMRAAFHGYRQETNVRIN